MDKNEIEIKIEQAKDRIPNHLSELQRMSPRERDSIIAEFDAILSEDPKNTDALYWKAMIYEGTEEYDKALEMYRKVLEINPNDSNLEFIKISIENCKYYLASSAKRQFHKKENPQENTEDLLDKMTIWQILFIKAIIIAAVVYFFILPLLR